MSLTDDEIAYILVVNDLDEEFRHEADEAGIDRYFFAKIVLESAQSID